MSTFSAVKLTDRVYWVGAIDWNLRDFHGYSTYRGTTYNAYLFLGDKVTLIDTAKSQFAGEVLGRIASVISPEEIDYTGIQSPSVVVALSQEGVDRRRDLFRRLESTTSVLKVKDVQIPATDAQVQQFDLKKLKIKKPDWALASLAILASQGQIISLEMLTAALKIRFKGKVLERSLDLIQKTANRK